MIIIVMIGMIIHSGMCTASTVLLSGGRGTGDGKCIAVRFPSQYPLVLLVNVDPTEEKSVEKRTLK